MIDYNDLDNMDLPKSNFYEELETLSEQSLQPLFEPARFELCTRDRRDKGIDLIYEIKRNDRHTGFRFIIQLKATQSIEANKDGSFSKSIETSNINYLLNNGHCAFYILFDVNTKTFYYEDLANFHKNLNEKDENWYKQPSHVLRFSKRLLPEGIDLIYDITLKNGLFQRNLRESTIHISASINKGDRVSFDANLNIIDDTQIREWVELLGFELINEGKWGQVLAIHQKATGNVATTARYNLVLGLANYYGGICYEALSFLKKASNLKSELNEEMQMVLAYFDSVIRYSINQIDQKEYEKRMNKLENSETVGLYIRLEKAKQKYSESLNKGSEERFDLYVNDIEEIINHPKANEGLILTAKCELLLFQGYFNNYEYIKAVTEINIVESQYGVDMERRIEVTKNCMAINEAWYKSVGEVIKEAQKQENYFSYFIALIYRAKITYHFSVHITAIQVEKEIEGYPIPQQLDQKPMLEKIMKDLHDAIRFFESIGHIENIIVAASTLYEILHYLERIEETNKIMVGIETLVDQFDLLGYIQRLEYLKSGNTTHELLKNSLNESAIEAENNKREYDQLREEMIKWDEQEKKIEIKSHEGKLCINLFPIGHFMFPEEKKELVYEIIGITNTTLRNGFDSMFKFCIPIANILYNPIEKEGLQDGMLADKGIENWRNIYKIRKAFYQNGFYRIYLGFARN